MFNGYSSLSHARHIGGSTPFNKKESVNEQYKSDKSAVEK